MFAASGIHHPEKGIQEARDVPVLSKEGRVWPCMHTEHWAEEEGLREKLE
jgi:hypothetical protein